jgi:hypoxanthine phosphoribosyltransferase
VCNILDSGHTLGTVREKLQMVNPRSIRVCVLLRKKKLREQPANADYVGFEIEDEFVIGYGWILRSAIAIFPASEC